MMITFTTSDPIITSGTSYSAIHHNRIITTE